MEPMTKRAAPRQSASQMEGKGHDNKEATKNTKRRPRHPPDGSDGEVFDVQHPIFQSEYLIWLIWPISLKMTTANIWTWSGSAAASNGPSLQKSCACSEYSPIDHPFAANWLVDRYAYSAFGLLGGRRSRYLDASVESNHKKIEL